MKHSGVERLALVHPDQLVESIRGRDATLAKAIKPLLSDTPPQLLTTDEVVARTQHALSTEQRARLTDLVWMGTLAAIVYMQLRIPYVHRGGGSSGVVFSNTFFRGNPVPQLDYETLLKAFRAIVDVARSISEKSGKWFGHDFNNQSGDT
jgi:hypothetical protein